MAWSLDYSQNTDAKGIGSVRAVYDNVETKINFVIEERLDTNDNEAINRFVDDALARLQKETDKVVEKNEVIAKIQEILNNKGK